MEQITDTTNLINNIDTNQVLELVEQIKNRPTLAEFKFRASNRWQQGTCNIAMVNNFFGIGENHSGRPAHDFTIDEPTVLLGNDLGANPVEYLLVGLSGCLTTAIVIEAAMEGIRLDSVESNIEGDLDIQGFLGLREDVPVEYQAIKVSFRIEADIPIEKKQDLIEKACKLSPVLNSLIRPVKVDVRLDGH